MIQYVQGDRNINKKPFVARLRLYYIKNGIVLLKIMLFLVIFKCF